MKTKLMALLLMAGGSMFAETHFSFGVNVGGPRYYAPPVAVAAYRPASPGPGYVWINGYNDGYGNWINGYWALPPYTGSYWIAPRYDGGRFVAGYWGGVRHDRDDFRVRESRDHDRGFDRGREFNRGFRR